MSEKSGGKPWLWSLGGAVLAGIILFALESPIKELGKRPAKRLSYAITEITNIYQRPGDTNISVQVLMGTNEISVESLWGYRVRLWNSGTEPLKDLSVEFHLSTNSAFYCLAERHNPQPPDQVGQIHAVQSQPNQTKTNHYQLLNPDHSDEVFFVVNMPADPRISARAEGLQIKREVIEKPGSTRRFLIETFVPAAFATVVAVGINTLLERRKTAKTRDFDKELDDFNKSLSKARKAAEEELSRFTSETLRKVDQQNAAIDQMLAREAEKKRRK